MARSLLAILTTMTTTSRIPTAMSPPRAALDVVRIVTTSSVARALVERAMTTALASMPLSFTCCAPSPRDGVDGLLGRAFDLCIGGPPWASDALVVEHLGTVSPGVHVPAVPVYASRLRPRDGWNAAEERSCRILDALRETLYAL